MEDVLETLEWAMRWLWSQWQVKVLVAHVLVNVVLAVAVSVRTGEFVLAKAATFLWRKVLPLVLVYGAFAFAGDALGLGGVAVATWALLETVLLGDMMDNLRKLGVPVPEGLTKARLP